MKDDIRLSKGLEEAEKNSARHGHFLSLFGSYFYFFVTSLSHRARNRPTIAIAAIISVFPGVLSTSAWLSVCNCLLIVRVIIRFTCANAIHNFIKYLKNVSIDEIVVDYIDQEE